MPTILPVDIKNPGPAKDLIDAVQKKLGTVPNLMATMAQSPAVLDGYLAFSNALSKGTLSTALREQIALAVAGENQCDYCASAHTLLAKHAGVSEEESARNLKGDATDTKTLKIIRFAQLVVKSRGVINETALQELRNSDITDTEIVEIIANIGINLFTNYFNHIVGTEVDFPLISTAKVKIAA